MPKVEAAMTCNAQAPRSLMRIIALSFAMAGAGVVHAATHDALPRPAASQASPLDIRISMRDGISDRASSVRVDGAAAVTLDLKFTDKGLEAGSARQVAQVADRLRRSGKRYLVIGSNDSASPAGRAGSAGFRHAKVVRSALIDGGMSGEGLVVAGWQPRHGDPAQLSMLESGARVFLVPLMETARIVAPGIGGDAIRTLALDSASSRLVIAGVAVGAPMSIRPPEAVGARQAEAVHAPPLPRTVPVLPRAPEPPASVAMPQQVRGLPPIQPVMVPAIEQPVRSVQPAGRADGGGCAPPRHVLDDFYPGGPFRDCLGRPRLAAR